MKKKLGHIFIGAVTPKKHYSRTCLEKLRKICHDNYFPGKNRSVNKCLASSLQRVRLNLQNCESTGKCKAVAVLNELSSMQ
jgi:hypothetical protein